VTQPPPTIEPAAANLPVQGAEQERSVAAQQYSILLSTFKDVLEQAGTNVPVIIDTDNAVDITTKTLEIQRLGMVAANQVRPVPYLHFPSAHMLSPIEFTHLTSFTSQMAAQTAEATAKAVEATKLAEAKRNFQKQVDQFGSLLAANGVQPPRLDDNDDSAATNEKIYELSAQVVAINKLTVQVEDARKATAAATELAARNAAANNLSNLVAMHGTDLRKAGYTNIPEVAEGDSVDAIQGKISALNMMVVKFQVRPQPCLCLSGA
jgi:hypothetical protein